MEIIDYLLARKKAGGGSDVTIEQLSVTENGTYSEQGIAYSPVVVNVPTPENSYQLKDVPSGTVSTIEDGTDLPMSSLKVDIEPAQDLHGYDSPWVGGIRKNLLQCTATTQTVNGVVFSVNTDGTVNISGTATTDAIFMLNTVTLSEGNYIVSGGIDNNCYINITGKTNSYGTDASFSVASGGETLTVRLYVVSGITVRRTFKPMIRLATETDPSYEPYSNICPISGWTEANVTRTGKNLWGGKKLADDIVAKVPYATKDTTNKTVSYTASDVTQKVLFANFKSNTQYSIYISSASPAVNMAFKYTDDSLDSVLPNKVITTNPNKVLKALVGYWVTGNTTLNYDECGIFEGAITAEDFEPYNGTTYTIEFRDGDNPLTVYGGTLDATSGELVVDRVLANLGNYAWTYQATNKVFYTTSIRDYLFNSSISAICSQYGYIGTVGSGTASLRNNEYNGKCAFYYLSTGVSREFYIKDLAYDDASNFKTAMNGVQLVYELDEPITYHLTPTQIRTLVGNNNIWADTGDIVEGSYFKSLT